MDLLELVLILATLLCTLIAGFVFAFATVVMPGIAKLDTREYIRAFQVIDGIIQAGQPIFGLVWLGSAGTLLLSAVMSALQLDGIERVIVIISMLAYVLGVQLPTFRVNVPMNNALQTLDVDAMDEDALAVARRNFEGRWVKWNLIRTVIAILINVALMLVLLLL